MARFDVEELSSKEAYKLLIGPIVPRPIGWVSTMSADGDLNVAPFSYFNAVCSEPPMLGFSVSRSRSRAVPVKDTLTYLRQTGGFVVNLARSDQLRAMAVTSLEFCPGIDEFELAGLTPLPSDRCSAPRIAEAPVSYECALVHTIELGMSTFVIGRVLRFHIEDGLVNDAFHVDVSRLRPLAKMAGPTYSTVMNTVASPDVSDLARMYGVV